MKSFPFRLVQWRVSFGVQFDFLWVLTECSVPDWTEGEIGVTRSTLWGLSVMKEGGVPETCATMETGPSSAGVPTEGLEGINVGVVVYV